MVNNGVMGKSTPDKVVLHVISGDLWAGAEMQVYQTLLAMKSKERFIPVCVLFNEGLLEEKLRMEGIETIVIDESSLNSMQMLCRLVGFCKKFKPGIIHAHHIKEHFLGAMAAFFIGHKVPLIRTLHGKSRVPDYITGMKRLRSNIVVQMDKFLIRYLATCVIAVSKDIEKHLKEKSVKGFKVVQIYNALRLNAAGPSQETVRSVREFFNIKERFWIGTASRLVEPKNHELLIEAGKRLRDKNIDFVISIFGEGPLYNFLKNKIWQHNLQSYVLLHGFNSDMQSIMGMFDVFVLSSRHEGLPMALLEAMSLGLPVVCTNVGGMREIVKNGFNGLLVSPRDPSAMAEALIRIKNDPELAWSLAGNAKETVTKEFSIMRNTEKLLRVYDQLSKGDRFASDNTSLDAKS